MLTKLSAFSVILSISLYDFDISVWSRQKYIIKQRRIYVNVCYEFVYIQQNMAAISSLLYLQFCFQCHKQQK